jgi:hypothetical protein
MKLGQLIRMGGLALALATGMAGCDDDDPAKTTDAGKTDATTDATGDTAKPDTVTSTDVPKVDAADGGADATEAGSDTGSDVSSEAGTDSSAD